MRGCDLIKVYPAKFIAFHSKCPTGLLFATCICFGILVASPPFHHQSFPRSLRAAILSRDICWVAISQSLPTPRLTPLIPLILPRLLEVSNKCHTLPGSIGYRPASPYQLFSTFCEGCDLFNFVCCGFVILTFRVLTQDVFVCYQKR